MNAQVKGWDKGPTGLMADEQGDSYWMPKPMNGYVTLKFVPANFPVNMHANGFQVLPPGGEITLRTRLESEFVRVFIIDNGPGIPADILPRVLEPFFTTKPAGEGSGLGLDIALRIIETHNGKLEISSEPGRTEFCAWLPVG